jgi:hypothetical protein
MEGTRRSSHNSSPLWVFNRKKIKINVVQGEGTATLYVILSSIEELALKPAAIQRCKHNPCTCTS